MNVVVPFGFYGAGNIGDEATLQGFASVLRGYPRRIRAWVASQNPVHTALAEPAFRYYRYRGGMAGFRPLCIAHLAKAYVFAGGTPIMDGLGDWPLCEVVPIVRHAKRWGKAVVFVGTGTEHLERPASRELVAEVLASAVAHWSVRSARDCERLVGCGVAPDRVTVAADMAWLLPPVSTDFGERTLRPQAPQDVPWVGVNVNAERALVEREPRLFEKLAALLDRLMDEHQARVVFLCNEVREDESFDKAAARAVQSHMRRADQTVLLGNEYRTPQQMMSIVAACRLTISTRYHFCLFSALQGVPFLAIKRADKVADLCEDLQWPYGAMPGSVDAQELARQAAALLAGRPIELQGLPERVRMMRNWAWRNHAALDAMHADAAATSRLHVLRAPFIRNPGAT